jgi:6-phosphogluconolactonase (cycloisomerase 2 family)
MHGFQPREPSPKEQALMNTTARRTLRGGLLVAAAGTLIVPLGVHAAQANDPSPQRPGAVFSMTNNKLANSITTFQRRPDGTLEESGSVLTGGQGTGGPEDSANGLVLANVNGETSPTNTKGAPKFVLALNGDSNDISVLRNDPDGLKLVDREDSQGTRPISITVNRGVAYVLNAGSFMCSGVGEQPSISGFTFDAEGQLTAIPGSTRPLSGLPNSGCTQVAFDKTGNVVIVDEQQADVITTYTRQADGTLSAPQPQQTTGNGPFGLTFTQRNQLLTTENFGAAPGQGALSSYAIDERSGALTPLSPSVRNGQSDTCWVAITDDNRFAFTSSFGDDGGISSYRVRPDGSLELLNSQAATVGAGSSDVALSGNSRYLYVKNSVQGTVTAFRIENDGALTRLDVDADGQGFGSIGLAAQ